MTDQIFENQTESVFEAMHALLTKKYGESYWKTDNKKRRKKKRQKRKR